MEIKRGEQSPNWKKRSKIKCLECGKEFYIFNCWMNKGRGKYCSRKCAGKNRHPLSPEHRKKISEKQMGSKNHAWKGGKLINFGGYVRIYKPEHPFNYKGYVFEHRLVMEQIIGRYLKPQEIIHHKNGVKTDNRPENLILTYRQKNWHISKCPKCGFEIGIH